MKGGWKTQLIPTYLCQKRCAIISGNVTNSETKVEFSVKIQQEIKEKEECEI